MRSITLKTEQPSYYNSARYALKHIRRKKGKTIIKLNEISPLPYDQRYHIQVTLEDETLLVSLSGMGSKFNLKFYESDFSLRTDNLVYVPELVLRPYLLDENEFVKTIAKIMKRLTT